MEPLRVISLGAGVQSSTMLLMSLQGDLPRADRAIFADTQSEPTAVYRHLEFLWERCLEAGFPLEIITVGSLMEDTIDALDSDLSLHVGQPPFFVKGQLDHTGRGQLWRKCTREYKIDPLRRAIRAHVHKGQQAESWIGISLDEKHRMRPSGVKWLTNIHPLVQKGMTRHDCLLWLQSRGYPEPPKSACIICPFRSNASWRHLRDTAPDDWQRAVAFDATLRTGKLPGVAGEPFLHQTCVPLDQAQIDDPHVLAGQQQLWGTTTQECEGACFV